MLHRLRLFAADFGEPIGVWLGVLIAFGILCFTGCGPAPELASQQSYKALAAATLATEGDAAPTPTPDIAPTGTCKNCKGTGRVGDGTVFVPCAVCGGDGKLDVEAGSAQPSVIFPPKDEVAAAPDVLLAPTKSASGCSCGDNCRCANCPDDCNLVARGDCPGGVCLMPQRSVIAKSSPIQASAGDCAASGGLLGKAKGGMKRAAKVATAPARFVVRRVFRR